MHRLLVVDDDKGLIELVKRALRREGFDVEGALAASDALARIAQRRFDLLLLDFRLPDMSAMDLVDTLGRERRVIPFIVVTGQGDERVAVEMMKRGARDYLVKDQLFLERLAPVVARALEQVEQEKKLERAGKALREKESLAELGKMAVVVAHEVKNPLAAISGALQVIQGQLPAGSPSVQVIDEVLARVDSLNNSLDEMLLFARSPSPRFSRLPLRDVLESAAALLVEDKNFSAMTVAVKGEERSIRGDRQLLRRAFLNLLVNAAQAMDGRGEIPLEIAPAGKGVRVSIKDRGPGIPDDVRESALKPFFTTKNRGTGLGLPTALRIIESHGGTLSLSSPPAGGTEAVVELPLDEA